MKGDGVSASKRELARLFVAIGSPDAEYERDARRPDHGDETQVTRAGEGVFERRERAAKYWANKRKADRTDQCSTANYGEQPEKKIHRPMALLQVHSLWVRYREARRGP